MNIIPALGLGAYLSIPLLVGSCLYGGVEMKDDVTPEPMPIVTPIQQVEAKPLPTLIPETVPPWVVGDDLAKLGCEEYLKVPDGAKRDFLWKQADGNIAGRGAVAFLPMRHKNLKIKILDVYVMKGGEKIATPYERTIYTHDGRQFWRFRKPISEFPSNVVLHFGRICAVLKNPRQRID